MSSLYDFIYFSQIEISVQINISCRKVTDIYSILKQHSRVRRASLAATERNMEYSRVTQSLNNNIVIQKHTS